MRVTQCTLPTNVTCLSVFSLSLSHAKQLCAKHMRLCCWGQVAQVTMSTNLQDTMHVSLEGLSAPRLRTDTQVFVGDVANRFCSAWGSR